MPNPVLAESGDFALSIPVTLTHYGGAVSTTRGVLGRLPQSPGQLEGSYSDSDWCCLVRSASEHRAGRIPDGQLDPLAGARYRG